MESTTFRLEGGELLMDNFCPICGRPMPDGTFNTHHLVPNTFGGKETIQIHRICHDQIHAVFTERELQR